MTLFKRQTRTKHCLNALGMSCAMASALALAEAEELPQLEEMIVEGSEHLKHSEPTELTEQLLKVPGTLGDPLSAVFSLPGVLETDDGKAAVRGSSPRDNAFNIDFLPAGYVFHDFGNSIFNENLIRDFGLQAGGFGAEYGDANGAIFDVSLRDPRDQAIKTTLDASFLQAGLMLEGTITPAHTFYLSARESLLHILLRAFDEEETDEEDDDLEFEQYPRASDYQAKYLWRPNEYSKLSILALGASDRAAINIGDRADAALVDPGSRGSASIDTAFNSVGAHWVFERGQHHWQLAAGRLFESRRDRLAGGAEFQDIDSTSITLKSRYDYQLNDSIGLTIGAEQRNYRFDYEINARYRSCSEFTPSCDTDPGELIQEADSQSLKTLAAYIESEWSPVKRLHIKPGVRWQSTSYLDETHVEPRLSARWNLTSNWNINGAWGQYHQLPDADEIVPRFGNPNLVSPKATHYVLGLAGNLERGLSLKFDIYYKDLAELVVDVADSRNYLNAADGKAYGAELMLRRQQTGSPWYGWLSLSYARSERRNALSGLQAKADYDTPLVAKIVFNYQLGQWNIGARWNYRSGLPFTPIIGNQENPDFAGFYRPVYGRLNSSRAGAYHRLDLRAEHPFTFRSAEGFYYFDIINAYNNDNGSSVVYKPVAGSPDYVLEQEESYGLLPSVGIKLSF